jgi:predicted deacylase
MAGFVFRSHSVGVVANDASFSLGYALELKDKLAVAAGEREVDALWQELSQAKAELVGAKKAVTEEVRGAREAVVRDFRGSTEQVVRFAEHAGWVREGDG